ncbi:MAG: T9SS type A sorting domain-containing protein [candidate division WOR-3 bacterium]
MFLITSVILGFALGGPYKATVDLVSSKSTDTLRYHTCYEDQTWYADAYYPAIAGTRFKVKIYTSQDSIKLDMVGIALAFNFPPNNFADSIQVFQDGRGSPDTYLFTLQFTVTYPTPAGLLIEGDIPPGEEPIIKPTDPGDSIILWLISPNQVSGRDSALVALDATTNDPYTSKINFVYEDNGPWVDIYTTYGVGNDWGFTIWYDLYSDVWEEPVSWHTVVKEPCPNPARSRSTLRFSVPSKTNVDVGLYDLTGRLVKTALRGSFDIGWHSVDLDVSDLSPGNYMVLVSTEYGTETRLLVVK